MLHDLWNGMKGVGSLEDDLYTGMLKDASKSSLRPGT